MKVAIAGYGVEGQSNYAYYAKDPANDITIVNEGRPSTAEPPQGVKTLFSKDSMQKLDGFDLVVRTAGLSPHKIITDGKIWSATNEFFEECPAPIIGVTGTKGKGTTVSLIGSILEAAGKKVWLLGNIGNPALDVLGKVQPSDYVVYELSSFQLWDIERSPQIAVVLFIEGEHLDVHKDIEEYVLAKANIAKFQSEGDSLVYNKINPYAIKIANMSAARKKVGYPSDDAAHVKDGYFWYGEQKVCSTNVVKLVGKYHYENVCAAIDAVWGIINDVGTISRGIGSFMGLPHRLQFVREVSGVKYYDDSIATTPSSAIADLRSFSSPKIIILGGSSKGASFEELAHELREHSVQALLIGDEADNMAATFKREGFREFEIIDNPTMEKVVRRAHGLAVPGDIVLLSPAAASFGLFKNYVDRGDQFISAVNSL